jgi:hypothetical protein
VLVACKCDHHPAHRKVDPAVVEKKAKTFLGEVNAFQTSEASPDAYRGCLSVITRAVISSKRRECQPCFTCHALCLHSVTMGISNQSLPAHNLPRALSVQH